MEEADAAMHASKDYVVLPVPLLGRRVQDRTRAGRPAPVRTKRRGHPGPTSAIQRSDARTSRRPRQTSWTQLALIETAETALGAPGSGAPAGLEPAPPGLGALPAASTDASLPDFASILGYSSTRRNHCAPQFHSTAIPRPVKPAPTTLAGSLPWPFTDRPPTAFSIPTTSSGTPSARKSSDGPYTPPRWHRCRRNRYADRPGP
jgi:hypothetical protein